jgi:hypothetical protein
LIDLTLANLSGLDFRPVETELAQDGQAAEYIQAKSEDARIYSPSYSIPQHIAARLGLELADGVDPLQLAAYAELMANASGVAFQGYSVTLPPMASGDPATDNSLAVPDARLLGILHVGYVTAAFDLQSEGLIEEVRFGDTRIYHNQYVRPSAWVQETAASPGEDILSAVSVVHTANSLSTNAQGPGMLVFSEVSYPGWIAYVDGQKQEIRLVGELLRGVSLMPGEHSVEMVYRPAYLYVGAGISLSAWMLVGGLLVARRKVKE